MSENGKTTVTEGARNERLITLFGELDEYLKDFIRQHEVDYDEWHSVVMYLHELGQSGEVPLFLNLFLESTVEDVTYKDSQNSGSTIEGPYYIDGPPVLDPPFELPRRENEPGDVLFFSGTVRGADGEPLPGALLDIWQSDGNGNYSGLPPGLPSHDPTAPDYNLRGKIHADPEGNFEVRSVVPTPYEIPAAGPTGRFYKALDITTFRPAHIHLKISHEGYETLITQLFFEGDEYLDKDAAQEAVKDELITKLEKHDDHGQRGLEEPYYTTHYDFVLAEARKPVAS